MRDHARLKRQIFTTSRRVVFCSQKELLLQTGPPIEQWPLVVLKELLDNALDACEEARIAPVIKITVKNGSITVVDNGPGIAPHTVESLLDFSVRVSSRATPQAIRPHSPGRAPFVVADVPTSSWADHCATAVLTCCGSSKRAGALPRAKRRRRTSEMTL